MFLPYSFKALAAFKASCKITPADMITNLSESEDKTVLDFPASNTSVLE